MGVVAFVEDLKERIEASELVHVGKHAHAWRGHAVSCSSGEMIAVGNATDSPVMLRAAVRTGYSFALNSLGAESRQTVEPSDLHLCLKRTPEVAAEGLHLVSAAAGTSGEE